MAEDICAVCGQMHDEPRKVCKICLALTKKRTHEDCCGNSFHRDAAVSLIQYSLNVQSMKMLQLLYSETAIEKVVSGDRIVFMATLKGEIFGLDKNIRVCTEIELTDDPADEPEPPKPKEPEKPKEEKPRVKLDEPEQG